MAAPLPGPVQVVADDLPGAGGDQPGGVVGADSAAGSVTRNEQGIFSTYPARASSRARPQFGVAAPYFASGLT